MNRIYNTSELRRSSIPLIPLRHKVVFPGSILHVAVGRRRSVALAQALEGGQLIGFAIQRDPEVADPGPEDLYPVGVVARVRQIKKVGSDRFKLLVEGVDRISLEEVDTSGAYLKVRALHIEESRSGGPEVEAAREAVLEAFTGHLAEMGQKLEKLPSTQPAGRFADIVAATLGLSLDEEASVVSALGTLERLSRVAELVGVARARLEIKKSVGEKVRQKMGEDQRKHLLREQIRALQKELGEDEEGEFEELEARLADLELPAEARKSVDRDLRRLSKLNPNQPEANVIRKSLEWIADLPWSVQAEAVDDIGVIEAKLDADHYGLDEVKKRILEHMAVMKLSAGQRGAILCLAGPPGVGKTSLGQSVAEAIGRPLVRIALGGVRDEAEIRGHRRTYVGARPGRIVHALREAKVSNPVILLDEIDKLSSGWQGSPEAALLEVLDPEQNKNFQDHYLELPFDLSDALFICTANDLSRLSAPLRDRLEVITVDGYTPGEKVEIARRHLWPRRLGQLSLSPESVEIEARALEAIVTDYTREAGVRQLDREIKKICRALALALATESGEEGELRVGVEDLNGYLGKKKFFAEVAESGAPAGVATGLAWTPVGGDILFIETSMMQGKGRLEITGQLGDVMRESAKAALTYVRSRADALEVEADFLESLDLHIHVPAGAVPKDGPSAGVTIFTALTSLLTGRRVRSDTAMTGEATLRGRVLPVGGIKAKVMAAHRAGMTRVIIPSRNARDLDDVPREVRDAMTFFPVEDMSEALEYGLEPALPKEVEAKNPVLSPSPMALQ